MRVPRPAARITGRTLSEVWLIAWDGSTPAPHALVGPPRDGLDLNQGIARKSGDLDRAAGGRRFDYVPRIGRIELSEVAKIDDIDVRLDDIRHGQARRLENRLEVEEGSLGLILDAVEQRSGHRIESELAGAEDEAVDLDGL
jgi:hypothetical protein